jgi:NAD-dependent SIR2 family protein deacetylase
MILQKNYKCNSCKNTFVKSESERFVKSILPQCPVCGSEKVELVKTFVVGKKPTQQ